MDYKIIQQLLDKYWEGDSSLKEEAQLKAYFNNGQVHESLKPYQSLFQFYQQEAKLQTQKDFGEALKTRNQPRLRSLRHWTQMAAAIAAIVCFYLLWPATQAPVQKQAINWSQYEVTEEQEALRIVKGALLLTSKKLKKGTQTAAEGIAKVQKATQVVN